MKALSPARLLNGGHYIALAVLHGRGDVDTNGDSTRGCEIPVDGSGPYGKVFSTFIPIKHILIIRENLENGKTWRNASPMYDMTRIDAAAIMNLNETEIKWMRERVKRA